MRHPKRLFILFITLCLLSTLFSACGSKEKVMDIGNYAVNFDEYRYFYMNCFNSPSEIGSDPDATAHADAMAIMKENYAIRTQAKEYGLTLNKAMKESVEQDILRAKANYGDDETYETALAENYLTEELYRELLQLNYLRYLLFDYMSDEFTGCIPSDDATVAADINTNFMHAAQIYLSTGEGGENTAAQKKLAEEILAKLAEGADFDALASEYSEETSAGSKKYDYYFTSGEMLVEFEDAVKALKEGEISGIVESSTGLHIIKRLPMVEEEINEQFEDLRYTYQVRVFNEMMDEKAELLTVSEEEIFSSLTHEAIATGEFPKQ